MVDCSKNLVACDGILLGQYKGELCHQFFIVVIANGNGTVIISSDFFGVVSNACNAHIKHRHTVLISGDFKITGEAAAYLDTRKLRDLFGCLIVANETDASCARRGAGRLCKIGRSGKSLCQTAEIKSFGIVSANVCVNSIAIAIAACSARTRRSTDGTLFPISDSGMRTTCATISTLKGAQAS